MIWKVHPAEPAWQVHLPDRIITRWGDEARWHAEIEQAFAGDARLDRTLAFFRALESVSDAVWDFAARRPAWPPANVAHLVRTAQALRPRTLVALPHLFETVGDWARRSGVAGRAALAFLDGQLLISAQTTAARASALFGAAAIDLPRKGVNHVEGGIGTIAIQLADAVRRFGGEVLYRQEVTRFETREGRIVAAHTNKGARFECDACIANLTPWDLARLLGDAAPARLSRETQQLPDEWGAFTLYAGVEEPLLNLGHFQGRGPAGEGMPDHFQVITDYDKPLGEGHSVFLSFNMPGDAGRAPAGRRTLTISTHTRAADWWNLRQKPGGQREYDDRVGLYTERLLEAAERAVPGLRRRVRLLLPGTPVTFRFFTRRHKGGVGGFPFTSIFKARGPWTGLGNAWLVGDSIFPGQSTAGVTMGALRVVDEVLRSA